MNAFWLVVVDGLDPFKVDVNKVWEAHSGAICRFLQMGWGECKNVVMGDDCGCQNLELSSNDPILCGYCDCHKHFHVRPENDIPNFGPCQKKHDGKYCGCQSYSSLQEIEKKNSCYLHHQNFHKKHSFIVVPTTCSQTTSTIALHIDLTTRPSCPKFLKWGFGLEDMSSHENDGLKKVKFEFLEHDGLEVEEMQDDLESYILKVDCDKVVPTWLMKNWKECEEDSLWGFARWGAYYPWINHKKKTIGKWVMYCVPCEGREKYQSIIYHYKMLLVMCFDSISRGSWCWIAFPKGPMA